MNRTIRVIVILGLIFCLSILELPAQGGNPSRPRSLSSPGSHNWSPVREFEGNSFGAGDLPGSRPATGGGVLGSSIYSGGPPAGTKARGSSGDHTSPQPSAARGQRTVQIYDPMSPLAPTDGGALAPRPRPRPSLVDTVLSEGSAAPFTTGRPALTSLAPPEAGAYRAMMLKGEAALKSKDYAKALESFAASVTASKGAAEAHLSVMHTQLAMADEDYEQTAAALRQALHAFPMLAMAKVHPKEFLADDEYERLLSALEQFVEKEADAEAMFVLGYLRWRDNRAADAIDILSDVGLDTDNMDLFKDVDRLLTSMGALRSQLAEDAPSMQDNENYLQAGLRLALPEGFRHVRLTQINCVLAVRGGSPDSPRAISLTVFALTPETSLDTLASSAAQHLNSQVGVAQVKTKAEAEVPFLGGRAHVRTFECEYDDRTLAAARVCFIREAKRTSEGETPRLGYVLSMGVTIEEEETLLPTLAAVTRSIAMVSFTRPVDLPISELGHDMTDTQWGFSVRQPLGWAGSFNERGFTMGRFDNLLSGAVTPRVEVIASDVAADETAERFGTEILAAKAAEGVDVSVISKGPATLAGQDGYEFTVRKVVDDTVSIEVGRLICVDTAGGTRRLYALVVRCQEAETEQAQAILAAIAPTVTLTK